MSPAALRALRRLAAIWLLVFGAEQMLYLLLGRSRFLDDRYMLPALAVLFAGVLASVSAVRRRRAERRAADRRTGSAR